MPRRPRSRWRRMGVATSVEVSGTRVPVTVRRPRLDITREMGTDLRLRRLRGGTSRLLVRAVGGGAGGRLPGMPYFDRVKFRAGLKDLIGSKRIYVGRYLGGTDRYARFISDGKHKSKITEGFPTTASLSGKKVRTVLGGGKVSFNPVKEQSVYLHPWQTLTNVIRRARNRRTGKAENIELGKARAAVGALGFEEMRGTPPAPVRVEFDEIVRRHLRRFEAKTTQLRKRLEKSYLRLRRAYLLMGRGKITPEAFDLMAKDWVSLRVRTEKRIDEATRNFESDLTKLSRRLNKEREDRGL